MMSKKTFVMMVKRVLVLMDMMVKPLIFICLLESAYLLYMFINLQHMMVLA